MIVSMWTIYWVIGMVLISFILDERFASFIRANTKHFPSQMTDVHFLWLVFFAVCISALFWPFMIVPRRNL